ncbi:DNA-binding protein [Pseudomonas sp. C2B4]|uniref:DNA-binding protein n=1 Tax=Pseudomonas sp. C2B4 TaxID=2735270 RepID=UPI0015866735|nr:DNA-binding protein [Pseudomonas sp. C2B4]NUU39023.1 DNA-binding protein [Pseudomonas sp. C2B4]
MTVDLSDEEIFAAADAILASGQSATPARVRAHLGRGNPQRIGALLDQWWSQLLTRLRQDTFPATLAQALGMLWEQATALGRQDAERARAREREAWVEERRLMEKAFAKQRQALEHLLTKERQALAAQRQRALRSQEQLRERLRQSRETAKEAKRAVRDAQKSLDRAQRQLVFAQAVEAHHRRRDHVHALELNAAYRELSSRPLSVAEPSAIAASSPEGDGANLWRDFMPLLEAAQRTFEPRFAELRRLLNAEFAGPGIGLSKTERDRCIGQLLVDQHLLDELRQQIRAYSHTVDELCFEFMPLFLEMRQRLLG